MNLTRAEHIPIPGPATTSRRKILRGLGWAALKGLSLPASLAALTSAPGQQVQFGAAEGFHNYVPDMVSAHPIPLSGDRFLINGRVVTIDLRRAKDAFRKGAATFSVEVDGATYELTPSLAARAVQKQKLRATPVAQRLFEPPPVEMLEGICGGFDDSQDVEQYDGSMPGVSIDFVKQHQPMVGVLRWKADLGHRYLNDGNVSGKRVCSGTLIDHDLFLTAGHCITPPPELGHNVPSSNETSLPISKEECATNMKVEFDFQLDPDGNDRTPRGFQVLSLEEHRYEHLNGRDYAIVRLDGSPGQKYGVMPLALVDPPNGSTLCIIGHPQGQTKRIAAGTAAGHANNWMFYSDLDTDGGCSGSGVLASPRGPLIGIHVSGGCGAENENELNYGLRLEALAQESDILQRLVRR